MGVLSSKRVVVFGDLTGDRRAWRIWETVQYLLGFEKLGFESFFVQCQGQPSASADGPDSVARVMQRFGLGQHWGTAGNGHKSGAGKSRELADFIQSADLLLVLPGARAPMEFRVIDGPWVTLCGQNDDAGKRGSGVVRATAAPVVLDCWRPIGGVPAGMFAVHLSSLNHAEVLAKIDVPLQAVLGSGLQKPGNGFTDKWRVREEAEFENDPDRLRYFIMHSRGEIHFSQSPSAVYPGDIAMTSSWYLASGRPVLVVGTDCGGQAVGGLLHAGDAREAMEALQIINSDYAKYSEAALETARVRFGHEVVLRGILDAVNAAPAKSESKIIAADRGVWPSGTGERSISPARGFDLRVGGRQEYALVASCLGDGDTGGGFYAFDGENVNCIDRLSSTGMCVFENEGSQKLARLVWSPHYLNPAGELLVYDATGVRNYYRLDGVSQVHDVLWDGTHFIVVSTGTNSLVWFDTSGRAVSKWSPQGAELYDCWHLNSLHRAGGKLYVSAFGRFDNREGWRNTVDRSVGMVFDFESGQDLIPKLCQPHTPRFIDGRWLVCNSGTNELVEFDASGHSVQSRVELGGFTRGMATTDDYLFVGRSAKRHTEQGPRTASVAVLDRKTLAVLGTIELPCREVYELAVLPAALLEGVKTGFRTNPLRVAEQDQNAMFQKVGVQPERLWATGDPLPRNACRVLVDAQVPGTMAAGAVVQVPCTVKNLGSVLLLTAKPNPVNVAYKWLETGTGRVLEMEGSRAPLPATLVPGASIGVVLSVTAPAVPGNHILRITCVQEEVAWFDDIDPANAFEAFVSIEGDFEAGDSRSILSAGESNHV